MTILTISGSLRERSFNSNLLRSAESLLPEGVNLTHATLQDIPLFNADVEAQGTPLAVTALKQQIAEAHGVLIATPEYNFSYTGVLKNAIDWASRAPVRPFMDKPVAVVGASTGNFGAVRAQTELRKLMHAVGAHVLPKPELLVTQAASKFDEGGLLADEQTRTIYRALLEKFALFITKLNN